MSYLRQRFVFADVRSNMLTSSCSRSWTSNSDQQQQQQQQHRPRPSGGGRQPQNRKQLSPGSDSWCRCRCWCWCWCCQRACFCGHVCSRQQKRVHDAHGHEHEQQCSHRQTCTLEHSYRTTRCKRVDCISSVRNLLLFKKKMFFSLLYYLYLVSYRRYIFFREHFLQTFALSKSVLPSILMYTWLVLLFHTSDKWRLMIVQKR